MGFECNFDQKQHINLSDEAWENIDSDRISFSNCGVQIPLSKFLNTIILNFYDVANSTLSIKESSFRNELNTEINESKIDFGCNKNDLIQFLSKKNLEREKGNLPKYNKGEGRKFRLSNECFEILTSIEDYKYYPNLGSYLKNLFEEYSHKTFVEREKIFFKEHIKKVEFALSNNCVLQLKTFNQLEKIKLSPFCVKQDRNNSFNYLVGVAVSKTWDTDTFIKPFSIRISRIEFIKPLVSEKTIINKDLKKELGKELQKIDVSFISDTLIHLVIKFSENGLKKYFSYIRQRPKISEIIDAENRIYKFFCPYSQALYYFYKFGSDIEIVEPQKLRNKFIQILENSLKIYK